MNITEKYRTFLKDLQENPNIKIEDYLTKEYEPWSNFTIELSVEFLEEEGYILDDNAKHLLQICDAKIGWSGMLKKVDCVCTGGFHFYSFSDTLTFYSSFWKGAFSLAPGIKVPEHLKHFEQLGWFERRPDGHGDHNRGCLIKKPGAFPPPLVFYRSGWYTTLNMNLEEYITTMFDNYAVSGWQFFYFDITEDVPNLDTVLREMRVVSEQMPLLFPDKDWSYHRQRYEETLKRLDK